MTRLSCNIYNTSLAWWSFTDDTSVMQCLQQLAQQIIVHRWHVCHAICTTDGARFTHPWPTDIAREATSHILREQFPSQMNVHITDDTSIMEYLQQVAGGWGVLLRSTYMQATTEIQDSDQFPSQMIVHRWHVCHAIFTTAGGRLTRPPHSSFAVAAGCWPYDFEYAGVWSICDVTEPDVVGSAPLSLRTGSLPCARGQRRGPGLLQNLFPGTVRIKTGIRLCCMNMDIPHLYIILFIWWTVFN